MSRYLILALLVTVLGLCSWQLMATSPWVPRIATGLVLFAIGLLTGLRWSNASASRLIDDLVRLNGTLGEQNSELSQLNLRHLRRLREQMIDEDESSVAEDSTK